MRRWMSRLAAFALLMLLPFLGAGGNEPTPVPSAGAAALWEPSWSPSELSLVMHGSSLDVPMASCRCDVDGDGMREMVVLGQDFMYYLLRTESGDYTLHHVDLGSRFWGLTWSVDETIGGSSISCGDLNGDGRDDLVVGTGHQAFWVFLGRPEAGSFDVTTDAPREVATWSRGMWLTDATGDSVLDFVVASDTATGTPVDVLPGDGAGAFGAPQRIEGIEGTMRGWSVDEAEGEPGSWIATTEGVWFCRQGATTAERRVDSWGTDVCVGDFDQDGDTDVAVGVGSLSVFWRDGDGYTASSYSVPYSVQRLERGDVDGDGITELVAWSYSPVTVTVFGFADGELRREGAYGIGYSQMPETLMEGACADANEDGVDDVISLLWLGRISVLTKVHGGSSPQLAPGGFLLGTADLDADGTVEILAGTDTSELVALESDESGLFSTTTLPTTDTRRLLPSGWLPLLAVSGRLDDSGNESIACWGVDDRGTSRIALWQLDDGARDLRWVDALPEGLLLCLAATDADGDGRKELVVGGGQSLQVMDVGDDGLDSQSIPWGGDVGPFTVARLPEGERIVGFRSTSEASTLMVLHRDKAVETSIALPLSLFDLVANDVDGDGWDELGFVGLGVTTEDGNVMLTIEAGIADCAEDGAWSVAGPWRLSGWPAGSVPYPLGGLVLMRDPTGRPVLAISYAKGERTNGGIAWVTPPANPGETALPRYDDTPAGPRLVTTRLGDHKCVVSTAQVLPPLLRMAEAAQ